METLLFQKDFSNNSPEGGSHQDQMELIETITQILIHESRKPYSVMTMFLEVFGDLSPQAAQSLADSKKWQFNLKHSFDSLHHFLDELRIFTLSKLENPLPTSLQQVFRAINNSFGEHIFHWAANEPIVAIIDQDLLCLALQKLASHYVSIDDHKMTIDVFPEVQNQSGKARIQLFFKNIDIFESREIANPKKVFDSHLIPKIINLHRGQLQLTTTPNSQVTYRLTLPAVSQPLI